ncbi:MAG: sirohydrochlorin chelatase [Mycobacteriales bacterium]
MTLVLVMHGTRDPAGAATAEEIAAAVARRLGGAVPVALAYADVRPPGIAEVLAGLPLSGTPTVVVPAFLAAGYHVRVDVPREVARGGRSGVLVAEPLGPAAGAVAAVADRLAEAGRKPADRVVLAAAGSSDSGARAEVRRAAAALSARLPGPVRTPVEVGYLATGQPSVEEAVAGLKAAGRTGDRVAVASWLLAPGLFHRRALRSGAAVVSAPIGTHPLLIDLIARRYRAALDGTGTESRARRGPYHGYQSLSGSPP